MNKQKKKEILVVNDDPIALNLLKECLLACNYRVITAENGSRAIMHIQSSIPDAVITALYMPGVDGFELLRYTQKTTPELPIIVITGSEGRDDITQAFLLGAWDFVCMPLKECFFLQLKIEKNLEKSRFIVEKRDYCNWLEALVKKINIDFKNNKQALTDMKLHLEEVNMALKTLLDQREIEKKAIEQSMVINLKRFVFPYLDDLEQQSIGNNAKTVINIIRSNIQQLISPLAKNNIIGTYLELTQMEAKVADLIRQGYVTKQIAGTLNISNSTVEKHRNKIRQKLNIAKKKVNLYAYLNSLR